MPCGSASSVAIAVGALPLFKRMTEPSLNSGDVPRLVQYTTPPATAMPAGVACLDASELGLPPALLTVMIVPAYVLVQYTLLSSSVIPDGPNWPDASVTGWPPALGILTTVPPFSVVQYTLL